MSSNYDITASCKISDHVVSRDQQVIFEGSESSVADFLVSVYQHFGIKYPKFHKMDQLSKLGWLAAELLLRDGAMSRLSNHESVGVVLANANASLDTDMKYYQSVKEIPSPALFVYTLPNIVIGEICIRHQLKGENAFFIFEEFEAEYIKKYVSSLFSDNIVDACICGWVELLGEHYKAFLMLVERSDASNAGSFNTETINKIYNTNNG